MLFYKLECANTLTKEGGKLKTIKLNFNNGVNSLFSQLCIGDYIRIEESPEETEWILERKTLIINGKSLEIKFGELNLREYIHGKIDNEIYSNNPDYVDEQEYYKNKINDHHENKLDELMVNDLNINSKVNEVKGKFIKARKKS